ncbi:ribonuclease H-like protein [Agrocybe pediades]|nr:ribonuclease H-like protein [Agrocybe pediades]
MGSKNKGMFYAVQRGTTPGVYNSWRECELQVKGFPNARFQKFPTREAAEAFVAGASSTTNTPAAATSVPVADRATKSDAKGKKRGFGKEVEDTTGWDIVYSDGACKGNGKPGSIAGVGVWWGKNDPRNIAERCPGYQTNNRAELIAILRVLETTPITSTPLLIRTDSQYSMNCLRSWIPAWIKRNWHTAGGTPVKNVGIIRCIAAHLSTRATVGQKVRFEYVEGHSGEVGNDGADEMANIGVTKPELPDRDWDTEWKRLEDELNAMNASPVPAEIDVVGPVPEEPETYEPDDSSGPPRKAPKLVANVPSSASVTSSSDRDHPPPNCSGSSMIKGRTPSPTKSTLPQSQSFVTATARESILITSEQYVHGRSPLKVVSAQPPLVPAKPLNINTDNFEDCLLDDSELAAELSD